MIVQNTKDNVFPRLERLERLLDIRDMEQAQNEFYAILFAIDRGYGRLNGVQWVPAPDDISDIEKSIQFSTRLIAAMGRLICDPDFVVADAKFELFQHLSRWMELMASLSGFRSADSFIRRLGEDGNDLQIAPKDLLRFLMLYLPNSTIDVPLEMLQGANQVAFYVTALGWIGSRYCFGQTFFDRREKILNWLPGKLNDIKLGEITLANITESYFHCSYAMTAQKHALKSDLMAQMRRGLIEAGCPEWSPESRSDPLRAGAKPTIIVTAEYINKGHSIHRTHSRSVRALREKFHVVGVCNESDLGSNPDLFDDYIALPSNQPFFQSIKDLSAKIMKHKPAIVLHLAIGMRSHIIALAALRLAPVQCTTYGHTATSQSPAIDFFILPEDFVGSEAAFSEKLIKLPREAMPYESRTDIDYVGLRRAAKRKKRGNVIEIAVPATLMKLNPLVFSALRRIEIGARRPCHFSFFPGFAVGLAHAELTRQINNYLPTATIHTELPYIQYCEELAKADFMLSPFPYGNMNTIVEGVALGLPGICLDGPEAHSHADGALFARLGLPKDLNAPSIDAYVAQAIRLIDDAEWLAHCRDIAAKAPISAMLYEGNEGLFCDAVFDLLDRNIA